VKGLLIACFQALKSTGGWGIFKWPQVGDFGWPPGPWRNQSESGGDLRRNTHYRPEDFNDSDYFVKEILETGIRIV